MKKHHTHKYKIIATSLLVTSLSASAATIIYQPSVNLFDQGNVETFVNTTGTSVLAVNNGLPATNVAATVNGVEFVSGEAGTAITGVGGVTVTYTGSDNTGAFGDGSFSNNGEIFNLLRSATFNVNNVTFDNLTIGSEYLFQAFTHDGRGSRNDTFVTGFDGSAAAPSVTSDLSNFNVAAETGTRTGDFIIGTFVATSESQVISVFGSNNGGVSFGAANSQAQINGFQLRDITVPEPSSTALLGLGGLAFILRRRK